MVRNLRLGPKHVPGVVVQRLAPYSYLVKITDGMIVDHLHKLREVSTERRYALLAEPEQAEEEDDTNLPFTIQQMKNCLNIRINSTKVQDLTRPRLEITKHYPHRNRRPPNQFAPYRFTVKNFFL